MIIVQRIPISYPKRNHDGSIRIKTKAYLSTIGRNVLFQIVKKTERFIYNENERQSLGELQIYNTLGDEREQYVFSPSVKHLGNEYGRCPSIHVIIWVDYDYHEKRYIYKLSGELGLGGLFLRKPYVYIEPKIYEVIKKRILEFADPHLGFEVVHFINFLRTIGIDELDKNLDERWYKSFLESRELMNMEIRV